MELSKEVDPVYIDKSFDSLCFNSIVDAIMDNTAKEKIKSYFQEEIINDGGECLKIFTRVSSNDESDGNEIYKVLNRVGYNYIDVRRVIKLYANKLGAHTALNHPIGLLLLDDHDEKILYDAFDVIL
jgi:hypothetical protein